jgi:hypothetical protein
MHVKVTLFGERPRARCWGTAGTMSRGRTTRYLCCTGIVQESKSAMHLTCSGPLTLTILILAGLIHTKPSRPGLSPFLSVRCCPACTVYRSEEVGRTEAGKGGGEGKATGCGLEDFWLDFSRRQTKPRGAHLHLPKATFAGSQGKGRPSMMDTSVSLPWFSMC